MGYLKLFWRVAEHVERRRGVVVEFERGEPVTDEATASAVAASPTVPLPSALIEFYREVGDGMLFHWATGGSDELVFANIEFPPLLELAEASDERRSRGVEFDDTYEYSGVKDRQLAKRTARRMRRWFTFHYEGNGDTFCLDTGVDPAPVVFHQHDWVDGGSGDNGRRMGQTLRAFMEEWSQVCFQFPSSLWWPRVLTGSGVNWQSDAFDPRFRLIPPDPRQLVLPFASDS